MEDEESFEGEAALEELGAEEAEEDTGAVTALAEVLAPKPALIGHGDPSIPPYSRNLVLDLAMRSAPVSAILHAYKLTEPEFKQLVQHPQFKQDFKAVKQRLTEEGFTFRMKAQAQAEAYLSQAWDMVHDSEVPANVRADLIKWTAKIADLEPKQSQNQSAEKVQININLGGDTPPVVINSEPSA